MQFKLLINFERLSDPRFLSKAHLIKDSLSVAPALTDFPDPWPAIYPSRTALAGALSDYETAYGKAVDGSKAAIATRNAKRIILMRILKDIAPYLEAVARAANNIAMLETTGYDLRHGTAHINASVTLSGPVITVTRGKLAGQLIVRASRMAGAGSYEAQLATGDPAVEANWKNNLVSKSSSHITYNGLIPGTLYYVRVRAIGGNGPGAWSDIASLMVV